MCATGGQRIDLNAARGRVRSSLASEEVLGVRGSGEPLAQQAGEEHQRAQRPVVGCDVLRLRVGVEGDQVDAPERPAANLGGVVLLSPQGPTKLKSWRSYRLAD